jgi:hypothetical protein
MRICCKLKLDKENQNMLVWLSKMVFGTTFWHSFLKVVNDSAKQNICQKDCQKYDLTADACFGLAQVWVAITSVPYLFESQF